MTPLVTLGLFMVIFVVVLVLAQFRDWPERPTVQSHDWLVDEHREARLKAASVPHLFKGYKTYQPDDQRDRRKNDGV
jgi:hypothetical protein